jgi:hypothetical protein
MLEKKAQEELYRIFEDSEREMPKATEAEKARHGFARFRLLENSSEIMVELAFNDFYRNRCDWRSHIMYVPPQSDRASPGTNIAVTDKQRPLKPPPKTSEFIRNLDRQYLGMMLFGVEFGSMTGKQVRSKLVYYQEFEQQARERANEASVYVRFLGKISDLVPDDGATVRDCVTEALVKKIADVCELKLDKRPRALVGA